MNISTRSEMNVNACFSANAVTKFLISKSVKHSLLVITILISLLMSGLSGLAQQFSDNASNYSSWTNSSNQGTGFGAWSFTTPSNTGTFLGNPSNNGMGTTGIGTNAFAIFSTSSTSGYCNVSRDITNGLSIGDTLTFYWAVNWDGGNSSAGKGFDLRNGSTVIFNVNIAGSATITTTNGTANTNFGTIPMLVTVIRTSSSAYSFSMTARNSGGTTYSTTINSASTINNLNFYTGNQLDNNGNRNMYFNAFYIGKPNQYRSKVNPTGNWGTAGSWEISTDGGNNWTAASAAPGSSLYSTIRILSGDTISQNNNYNTGSNNNIIIEAGGVLNMTAAPISDMAFRAMTVSGTLIRNNANVNYSGTITVENGGKYTHAVNGGTVPACTWNSGSTFEVTGITSAINFTANSGIQNFHHVRWNCRSQASTFSFGGLTTINGNLTIDSTGASPSSSSCLLLTNGTAITATVGGNLVINHGYFAPFGSATASNSSLSITGNLSLTTAGATFDINRHASNTGTINLSGDLSITNGTITKGGAGTGSFNFAKSGTQSYSTSSGTISGAINFTVNNGSTLSMGTNVLEGSTGTFNLSSGAGLITSEQNGIKTTGTSSSDGAIRVGGSRTYSPSANYTFNGTSQNTGTGFTGAAALTIGNSVTLSTNASVSGTLTLSSGSLNLGGNTLTLSSGSNQSIAGSGSNSFNITNGTVVLTGSSSRTVTVSGFGTTSSGGLTLGTDVTLRMNDNALLDCGGNGTTSSMLTVLGTLQMNSGTNSNIANSKPPFYGSSSTLRYTASYGGFDEWRSGSAITTPGVPQNVTIDGAGITVTTPNSARNVLGNLTITTGTFALNATNGDISVTGNISNSGTFTHNSRTVTLNRSTASSTQTITGTFNNTATNNSFHNLTIATTNGATVTISTPVNVTNTLTLTSGIVLTDATNILNVTATGSGAVAGTPGGSCYISGPLRRSLTPSLGASSGTWVFPVGKSTGSNTGYYPISLVNPTTSTGAITITAEAFNTGSGGSAGTGLSAISSTEYWSVASSGNFTNSSYSVTRPSAVSPSNAIGRLAAATANGAYAAIGGTASGSSITSSSTANGAAQQFFVLGTLAKPVITGISASPNNGTATNAYNGSTITVTGTNLSNVSGVNLSSGATSVAVSSVTSTSFTFVLPAGASGTVTAIDVTNGNSDASASSLANIGFISTGSGGNWTSTASWLGGAAPSAATDLVTIASGAPITLNTSTTIAGLTINSGATFNSSDASARTLTISRSTSATTLTNSGGTWANGTGASTVVFTGAPSGSDATHTTSGTIGFQNVTINKTGGTPNMGITFGAGASVSGTLEIGSGGFVASNYPASFFGSVATVRFNTGGTYDVFSGDATWPSTGSLPPSIEIASGIVTLKAARTTAENLTISGGTFALEAQLTVQGNWNRTGGGTFTPNTQTVVFSGLDNATLSGASGESFYALTITKASSSNTITLGSNLTVTNTLTLTTGRIDNNSNIVIVTNGASNAISGGSANSYINGSLRRTITPGSGTWIFPVGKGSSYLPYGITNPAGTSPVVTVEAFASAVSGSPSVTSPLASVSSGEYWTVSNSGTFTSGTISLARATIGSVNAVGSSTTQAGAYASLGGGAANSTLIASNTITATTASSGNFGSPTYFVLGTATLPPTITGVSASPNNGTATNAYNGSTITVTGTNFTSGMTVTLSSGAAVSSSYTLVSATEITFALPTGASGTVTVQNAASSATSSSSITNIGFRTTAAGNYSAPGTWLGGSAPTASSVLTIAHNVNLDQNLTQTGAVSISSGATFTVPVSTTLQIGAGITGSGSLAVNGTLQINGSGFTDIIPTYGSSSSLVYNASGGYAVYNEWTGGNNNFGSTITAGAGIPNNVTSNFALTTPANGIALAGNFTYSGNLTLNGDLFVGGNWTKTSNSLTFTTNNKAVVFQNGSTQTISVTGGGFSETFTYLIIDKSAGSLQLSSSPATNVFVNYTTGNGFEILRGAVNLNGRTLTVLGTGGNVNASGSARTISNGTFSITGTKTFTSISSGSITFDTDVTVGVNANDVDFGNGLTNINGILDLQGGFIKTAGAPTYGSSSTLRYSTGTNYGVGVEWYAGQTTGAGVPNNVTVSAGSSIYFSGSNFNQLRGNLTYGTPAASSSSVALSNTSGGDLRIMGNWVENSGGTFAANGREVDFIGTSSAQTITANDGSVTFDLVDVNNSNGVSLGTSTSATINTTLTLTSGRLNIGANNLTLGVSATAVAGSPFSSSKMIIADGGGEVRKTVSANGNYAFPIGDGSGSADGADYSPITVTYTGTSYSSAYVGVSVTDLKHPSNNSSNNFLSRYWTLNQSGITGGAASVSATYTNNDVEGTAGSTSAARLSGTFNVSTNPWVKYSALSSNTLTTTSATVTAGTATVFTGITGSDPTVSISGSSSACINTGTVTLTANPSGGVGNFVYTWSNSLGSAATALAPTTSAGTTGYTVTVRDENGIAATSSAFNFTVNARPTALSAGTVTQPTCVSGAGSVQLTGLPSGGGTVTSNVVSGTGISDTQNFTLTSYTFTGLSPATTYNFTVTDANGCTSSSASNNIAVNSVPGAPASPSAPSNQSTCSNSAQNFTFSNVTAGSGADQIEWATNAGFTSSTIVSSPATININSVASGSTVTVYIRSRVSSNSCVSSPVDATVEVKAVPATPSAGNNGPVCAGNALSLTASNVTGATYSWTGSNSFSSSLQNPSVDNEATTAMAGSYSVTATVNGCTSAAGSTSVTINTAPSITGQPSGYSVTAGGTATALSVAATGTGITRQWYSNSSNSNTGGSAISGETGATYTPSVATAGTYYYYVVLTGTCGTETSTVATVTVNPANSETTADFKTSAASANFSSASNWQYNNGVTWVNANQAPTNQNNISILHATTLDANFTVANGKTFTISGSGTLTINPGVVFAIASGGSADFGGKSVTLKSTSAGTASIGTLSGTLNGATAVTVERYMTARRKWRALTAPLTGSLNNSIYANWQNGGTPTGTTGAIIWRNVAPLGSEDVTTGLWGGGASASMLSLNTSTNTWTQVSSTRASGSLFTTTENKAYMLFFTGPYNQSGTYITSGTLASTLSATGSLRTGNVVLSSLATGWHMIGNPYASSVNIGNVAKSGLNAGGYIWNPGGAGTGVFTPITLSTGVTIQSGQAFFVYSTAGAGSLTFEEADKVSSSSISVFRTEENSYDGDLKIELNKYVTGAPELSDVAIVNYKSRAEAGLPKLAQFFENMSIYQDNLDYGLTTRTLNNGEDQIQLRLWQMNKENYQIKIDLRSMKLPAGSTAVLQDAFLNKETPLSIADVNKVDFSVDANAASTGQRFRIVLRRNNVPVTSTETPRFHIYPNPVEKGSNMQLEFRNQEAGKYEVTVFSMTGVAVQRSVVRHNGGTFVQPILLDQRLSSGNYLVEITGEKGTRKQVKLTVQ